MIYCGDAFPAWRGNFFLGGLAGRTLVRLVLRGERVIAEERLLLDLKQRLHAVEQGKDGLLYLGFDDTRIVPLVPAGRSDAR